MKKFDEEELKIYKEKWEIEQIELKKSLVLEDRLDFSLDESKNKPLKYIGGVDISFVKDSNAAVASLVVLSYPELKVVLELYEHVEMKLPYISGYLAFREVKFLVDLVDKVKKDHSSLVPQVIMVDGSGVHHQRGFGIASHLGVLTGIPTIGIAKKLLVVDGLEIDYVNKLIDEMKGDTEILKGKSGVVHGAVYKVEKAKNPVYVSVGHMISLETSLEIVKKTCLHKNPEPVRQADLLSRQYIRDNSNVEVKKK